MKEPLKFYHNGSIGDVWASIPAMRQSWKINGRKIILYLEKDVPATYYEGAVHPTKTKDGTQVMLNQEMIDMMIPLLKAQSFIEDVLLYQEGVEINIDLSKIRDTFVNMPQHDLRKWYFYVYPDLFCDMSKPYIEVPATDKNLAKGKVIIARTERYHTNQKDFTYEFLKPYEDDLVFSGTMREYNNFCMDFDLNIKKLSISNFLELAQALNQSKGLISNQTQIFQIAEGMKIPRAVELCSFAPNVSVHGPNGFEFYNATSAEWYFHVINGTAKEYLENNKALFEELFKKLNNANHQQI